MLSEKFEHTLSTQEAFKDIQTKETTKSQRGWGRWSANKNIEIVCIHPFDILFRKNWLNTPNGTRAHVSWSLGRRDNHYTTGNHHAGNMASLEVYNYHRGRCVSSQNWYWAFFVVCHIDFIVIPGKILRSGNKIPNVKPGISLTLFHLGFLRVAQRSARGL